MGADQPKSVRLNNLAKLRKLEALQPKLEEHMRACRVWRLLGEACDCLQDGLTGRCRKRLKAAASLWNQLASYTLLWKWFNDIEADLGDKEVATAPAAKPEAPAVVPPLPPPIAVVPADATAIVPPEKASVPAVATPVSPRPVDVSKTAPTASPLPVMPSAVAQPPVALPTTAGGFDRVTSCSL